MPRFSIVLPVLGSISSFDDSLASILRNRPESSEIIIVHDGSFMDPHQLGDEIKQVVVDRRPHLIRMFNEAVGAATGEIIAFIRPGVSFEEKWQEVVEDCFGDIEVGMVSPALVSAKRRSKLIASGVDYQYGFRRVVTGYGKKPTSGGKPLGPTSWAGFYRKVALDQIGCIDEQLDPHYLDMEIALCISTLGFECEYADDLVMELDRVRGFRSEMNQPHGLSSQRAIRRHVLHIGTIDNTGRSRIAFALDLVSTPLAPWRLKHAFQKRKARRFNVRDEEFSDEISVRARRVRWTDTPADPEMKKGPEPKLKVFLNENRLIQTTPTIANSPTIRDTQIYRRVA